MPLAGAEQHGEVEVFGASDGLVDAAGEQAPEPPTVPGRSVRPRVKLLPQSLRPNPGAGPRLRLRLRERHGVRAAHDALVLLDMAAHEPPLPPKALAERPN
ncbi:hypothetical protein [Streptomyces dysideae]|uniref:hypothetical protein n=1 Tax=Streptomyces dysideae TaxID=909626 RepID=UPI0018FEE1A0|nr:hypothetical protein [Streptomyces dysideae]